MLPPVEKFATNKITTIIFTEREVLSGRGK
jgi:hypothetical protein